MTVAETPFEGQIEIYLSSTEFPAAPGTTTRIPILLHNRGEEEDVATLSVEGIPAEWVSTPTAFFPLSPGQRKEIPLTIQPPRSIRSHAGRQPIRIKVHSQARGGQVAEAACTLTVAAYTEFNSELHPQRLAAGKPGQVIVENLGNVQDTFTLTWRSEGDDLLFEPGPTQEIRVAPESTRTVGFSASPRQRPLFGGEKSFPFTVRVRSSGKEFQNQSGAVMSKSLFPPWLVAAVVVVALACLCLYIGGIVAGTGLLTPSPTEPAAPVEPTQAPQPTAPPQEPTEPPAPEEPTGPPEGGGGEPPEGGDGDPGAGCIPVAVPLALAPLAIIGRKRLQG
jgi:hypothetical protein